MCEHHWVPVPECLDGICSECGVWLHEYEEAHRG